MADAAPKQNGGKPGAMAQFMSNEPNVERFTPPEVVMAGNRTLGHIDLDPATTVRVNNTFIRATNIFTKEDDGLKYPWKGRVLLNPPGGEQGLTRKFWEKLVREFEQKNVSNAVYVAYCIDQLRQSQTWSVKPMVKFPFCIPNRRLAFYEENSRGDLVEQEHVTMSNAIVYLGKNVKKFIDGFAFIGQVIIPR
jgi:hypothetical protein